MEKRKFITNCFYYSIILGLFYLAFKYLLPVTVPFLIGFLIAFLANKLTKKIPLKLNKITKIIVLILLYLLIGSLVFLLVAYIGSKIDQLINWLSKFSIYIEPLVTAITAKINLLLKNLPTNLRSIVSSSLTNVGNALNSLLIQASTYIVKTVTDIVSHLPSTIVTIIVSIVSSFYILLDYDNTMESIKKFIPKKIRPITHDLYHFTKDKIVKILGSYMLIMFITFTELFIGLAIIGINNAGMISALIAVLDILPVLGVGTVLLPWFVIDIFIGKYALGIAILILYLVITVIRNIIEPKLVGTNLGLKPLLTLFLMITGAKLVGILGLFGFPLLASFLIYREDIHKNEIIEEETEETL